MNESNTLKIKRLFALSLLIAIVGGIGAQPTQSKDGLLRNREVINLVDGDYVEGFESGDFGKMTIVECHDMTGIISSGHNSAHCFNFYTGTTGPQYLISPEFAGDTAVQVSFYHKGFNEEPNESYTESFQIGYSTTTADVDAFAWYNDSISSETWTLYEEYFPKGTKYIAIKCTSDNQLGLCLDDFVFSVYEVCPKPTTPTVDVTVNSATLNWTGSNDGYEVKYGRYYYYDFEDGFGGWTTIDADNDGEDWTWSENSDWMPGFNSNNMVYSSSEGLTPDNFLVSPLVPLGGSISFYARGDDSWFYAEHFGVAVSTEDNPGANDFTSIIKEWDASYSWTRYTANLSGSVMGRVAIRHFGTEDMIDLQVDDITITGPATTLANISGTSYVLNNLDPGTYYVQVKGNTRYNEWSPAAYFTIEDYDTFVNDGDWGDGDNWASCSVPVAGTNVVIAADAVIPSNYTAEAGDILVRSEGFLTIQDGGQLKHNNEGVVATMKKNITPYSDSEGKDHYYLFGLPVLSSLHPSQVANMMTEDDDFQYDIYYFDESEEQEWKNIKAATSQDNFWFYPTKGFLYARDGEDPVVTLSAMGELNPSNEDGSALLYFTNDEAEFAGWNLIANPFACNAYLADGRGFYRLEEVNGESKIVLADEDNGGNVIAPMEGIFVQTTNIEGETITFTTEETEQSGNGSMSFSLRKAFMRSEVNLDRSLIRFGEGQNMGHLDLMADPNRLYIPLDGKAMSLVYSQPVGEMPLNFEAADDGTFVLGFTNNAEDLAYCHLIDNMTGADIDLLKYPEYTFQAKSNDYASRFRVVFVAKDTEGIAEDSETFAFNSYGSWIIVNEGLATLQMVDINGRMICNETIEGYTSMKFNVAPGVYVLRLVNGENVRVQKVVVR